MHGCHDVFTLDATLLHAWARDPSRQLEIAEGRCKLFLPIFCDVTRAAQAVLQQPAHVFITCQVICWRQFNEYSPSSWSVEIHPNQYHNLSSTFTRGNLRQHYFQRLQRWRRRVQQWPCVCLTFFRDPPLSISAHPVLIGAFPTLSPPPHVLPWRTAQGPATRLCCHPNATT